MIWPHEAAVEEKRAWVCAGGPVLLSLDGEVETASALCCHAGNSKKDAGAAGAPAGAAADVTFGSDPVCVGRVVSSAGDAGALGCCCTVFALDDPATHHKPYFPLLFEGSIYISPDRLVMTMPTIQKTYGSKSKHRYLIRSVHLHVYYCSAGLAEQARHP